MVDSFAVSFVAVTRWYPALGKIAQGAAVRSGAIVIHCFEFSRMVDFWSHVLNYVPREPAAGGWVVLTDPKRRDPNLSFQQRDHPEARRGGLHLGPVHLGRRKGS